MLVFTFLNDLISSRFLFTDTHIGSYGVLQTTIWV